MGVIIESSCADVSIEEEKITEGLVKALKETGIAARVENVDGKEEVVVYSTAKFSLSDYMPILQNFGFRLDSEFSYSLIKDDLEIYGRKYFLSCKKDRNINVSRDNVKAVLEAVLRKRTRNTKLNSLSVLANLNPEELGVLNAVLTYEDQLLPEQTTGSIQKTLIKYPAIAKYFAKYFFTKFNPKLKKRETTLNKISEKICKEIREVQDINDDKILNVFNDILQAIVRTNFFVKESLFYGEALAIKINVRDLSVHLKGVQPRIETFVYHNAFVGTHLRRTSVSRGGLRWSDRELDYREEIKSLMQAQRSKNSVIIPSGAKGGFFIKEADVTKERFVEVYSMFINALLDVVDNYEGEEIITPENMVVYDEKDPYFVVAADKGTSAMSDTANGISISRNFWLGDAFASGGSKGYSHKDMGITAKGSVKSTERFFIEQGINFYQDSIKVVGIGSPAGDVFGNGIQLSSKFALIAAISSRDIFIDPNPDIENAYEERQRLFDNGLGWSQHNKKLISKGGGVFKKSDKTITLTKEIKDLLEIKKDVINGEELSRAIITAKVDLLFNGGVGTYVRGNEESDSQIGDKPNESVRVNASDIKAYAVCEGGNLGFTQKARVDYAKKGGKISADSIDNSAGVHTSDYEVNLKIILNSLVKKGVISEENRLEVLHSLEDDVERIVLWTNYYQSLALSLDEIRSKNDLEKFERTISVLENGVENFKAKQYEIPEVLKDGLAKNKAILRPHLAVLLSFSKIFLKSRILRDKEFLDCEQASNFLFKYFPKSFDTLYSDEVVSHPLKRDIIATMIANKIINAQGSSFVHDYDELGQENFMLKVQSFLVLNNIVSANDVRHELYREDYVTPAKKQYELALELEATIEFLVSWVQEHGKDEILIFDREHEYKVSTSKFIESSDIEVNKICKNDHVNKFFSRLEYIRMLTTIIQVKEDTKQDFLEVANLFLSTTKDLSILELNGYIKELECNNEWDERLKEKLLLDSLQIVSDVIDKIMHFKRSNENIEDAFKAFAEINKLRYNAYKKDYKVMKASGNINYVNLSVVVGTLAKIADGSR